ncbi:glycine--tRNA ligase subunit beta [Sphingomonas jaspsi]|uniref:glycine--tRNA ligase subunit beta n=1 Tax=Sphingomonas jaspsi TaxID=392409 RepID=UPI0006860CB4
MQAKARNDLSRLFAEGLAAAGLTHDGIVTYSTPRRLALIAKALPGATQAVSEELKGPRTSAPPQALEGFLRKTGLTQDQLEDRDGVWFAVIDKPGRATSEVLAELIPQIVREFPWPKSMRWGAPSLSTASMRWVRPLHSIVALYGETIVDVQIEGVACGATTLGHRFHHAGPITIGGAGDYVEKLRACHVLVDQEERERIIRDGARKLADDAGFFLVEDEGLVVENAGLTEWPVPLLGSFDHDYLDVPEEVIQLTARINQKYFVLRGGDNKLAPHFICTANIDASDGGAAIVAGNERVLAARLSDARFFWEQDLKVPLEEQANKLEQIVFHEKLGTVADKVERVAKLARWLVEEGIVKGASADDAERAARLAKADLVTGMVGEFPELQGVIGGYLAAAQGEKPEVAAAIRDHYKPVGQGDEVPTAPVTVAVSLADKLDTLVEFWSADEKPTGSKDPFALRRAALAIIRTFLDRGIRGSQKDLFLEARTNSLQQDFEQTVDRMWPAILAEQDNARQSVAELMAVQEGEVHHIAAIWQQMERQESSFRMTEAQAKDIASAYAAREMQVEHQINWKIWEDFEAFFTDRLKVQQREAGVRHDLIDAVFALGGEDDLVRLLARVKALQAFVETGEGTNLLAGYKRSANILKKEEWDAAVASTSAVETEEQALIDALDIAEPKARVAVEAEDFTAAMAALASLRAPIDAFFDKVTVNADDAGVRARRLNLLARFRDAVHTVADFSKIEG